MTNQLADLGRAGEGQLVDSRMGGQRRAGLGTTAGDHVDHAGRDSCFQAQLAQAQRGQRGLVRRLEHHGAAAGQGRDDFQMAISNGKFHGTIAPTTPTGSGTV